ncbi:MAG: hypothetical protein ACOZJX_07050 [Pseudomonadota bacterium]
MQQQQFGLEALPNLPSAAHVEALAAGDPWVWNGEPQGERSAELLATLRQSGGVVTPDQLAGLLRPHHAQPVSAIARWLRQRTILSVGWRGQTFIPLCQFHPCTMQPREEFVGVLRELADAFDDWELVSWLAEPNDWLDGRAPASCLSSDFERVLHAARADRFIAKG